MHFAGNGSGHRRFPAARRLQGLLLSLGGLGEALALGAEDAERALRRAREGGVKLI